MPSEPRDPSNALIDGDLELFRSIADHAPAILWVTDPDGRCIYLNKAWRRFTGQVGNEALGYGWLDVTHPDHRDECRKTFLKANAEHVAFTLKYRLRTSAGDYRWVLDSGNPRFGPKGRFLGFVGSVVDIHDLKMAEEHQHLLIDELNHRVKNTLATVQALARQSAGPDTPSSFWNAFQDRLLSLASAHDLLTANDWEGAKLPDVVDRALLHWEGRQVERRGSEVWLTPQQALSLSMALHELITNAVKYGALSNPDGRVTISWRCSEEQVRLSWRERGGPPVAAPTKRGFGSRLLERSLARDLLGEVALKFAHAGVRCDITFPVRVCGPKSSLPLARFDQDGTTRPPPAREGVGGSD